MTAGFMLCAACAACAFVAEPWCRCQLRLGFVKVNHVGQRVGTLLGLPVALALAGGLVMQQPWGLAEAFGVLVVAALGVTDDLFGDRSVLGMRGHLGALVRGRPTTGALKALGGGAVALAVAWVQGGGPWIMVLHVLLLGFSANVVNLLDLRPGRAIKGCLMCTLALLPAVPAARLAPGAGAALGVLPWDLGGRAMLGDTGAMALGFSLGCAACLLPPSAQCALVLALCGVHLWAEGGSISDVINRRRVLRMLDEWGRGPRRAATGDR